MTYRVLVSVVTGVGFASCATFVIGYWWLTRGTWMRDEAGRFLMAFMGTLGTLLALVLVNQWVGEWPGRQVVTVALFTTFVAITWWPHRLLIKAQRRQPR